MNWSCWSQKLSSTSRCFIFWDRILQLFRKSFGILKSQEIKHRWTTW